MKSAFLSSAPAVLVLLLATCSCTSTRGGSAVDERTQWETRMARENREVQIRVNELEDLVAALKRDQIFQQEQLAALQAQTAREAQENRAGLAAVQAQAKALEALLEKKTGIILEEMSREMARLRRESAASSRPRGNYQQGYEHKVQSGETLSTIAAQYSSSVEAIADANGLDNPNSISVGQTLFVPAL